MTDRDVKSRRYDNSGRAEQARLLRRKVIDAAHAALLENGWSGTTIATVAARAGVSAETVYKRFGGKAGLLKAVYDVRLAGADGFLSMMGSRTTLRPDPEQARDVVWTLISFELYDLLVARRGWSLDTYQDWLARSLYAAVVETGPAGSSVGKDPEGRTT